jgi:glycosyltransferase involved in cell wall biosynthesis
VAVKQYPIAPLLSPRWKHWLIQDVSVDGNSTPAVPRFALYEQQFNPELKKQFPLETPNGLNGLVAWSKKALSNSAEWAWLKHHKSNAEKKLGDEKVISSSENELLANKKVFGINLFGFAFGELGIGEDLRMAVAVCEAAKVPYRVININAGATLRQADEQLKQEVADSVNQAPYAINLFCMPAFDMVSRIFLKMGPEVFQNHYNIGWWPWELSVWPKAWKSVFELVDEVWAGSQFTLNTYQKNTLKPCFHMPLAVSVDRAKTYTRKHFGLHKNSFTYLYVLDFNSSLKRKNPISLINAFQQAFSISDKSVALIFKVMNVQAQNPDWLEFKELCGADPRIKILDQTMDRPEVLGLIQICDAYVSPHCAEGFGRTLAEAMLFGKPVIATNYSGNVDFMNPKYTFPVNYQLVSVTEGDYHFVEADDQAEWAQISITELAQQMAAARESAKRPEYCEDLKLFAKSQFDIDIAAKLLKSRVAQIKKQLI